MSRERTNQPYMVTRTLDIDKTVVLLRAKKNSFFSLSPEDQFQSYMVLAFYQNHPGTVFANGVLTFFGNSTVVKILSYDSLFLQLAVRALRAGERVEHEQKTDTWAFQQQCKVYKTMSVASAKTRVLLKCDCGQVVRLVDCLYTWLPAAVLTLAV